MTLHISPTIAALIGLPPTLALVLTIGFVIFLFRRDIRQRPDITGALCIPLFWLVMTGARPVSAWIGTFGLPIGGSPAEEGSPVDAFLFSVLIVAGLCVLNKRHLNWSDVIQRNPWLFVFLAYCFIAIVWSDYPFVAFKRWVKIAGLPVMALILFTEPDFEEALARLMKRSAYILIPFSILAIKYYPDIGLKYDEWTGLAVYRGIAQSKNMLGCICLILGVFFFWHFLQTRQRERTKGRRDEFFLIGGFLLMIFWTMETIHSSTSLVCLLLGALVLFFLGLRFLDKKLIGVYLVLVVAVLGVAQMTFNVSDYALELLNKDSTLSNRTELWSDILKIKFNRIFGVGFESFWLGTRLDRLHEGRSFQPNEAHNGYLETYINLGAIGVALLVTVLASTFLKIKRSLVGDFEFGRLRLAAFVGLVLYNLTEASFTGPQPMWLWFYIIALDYPRRENKWVVDELDQVDVTEERELTLPAGSVV